MRVFLTLVISICAFSFTQITFAQNTPRLDQQQQILGSYGLAEYFSRARWLEPKLLTVVYPNGSVPYSPNNLQYWLFYGDFKESGNTISGGQKVKINYLYNNNDSIALDTSHLLDQVPFLVTQRLALVIFDSTGRMVDSTFIQLGELLDKLFYYSGNDLGLTWRNGTPLFKIWAPTAEMVRIHIFAKSDGDLSTAIKSVPLTRGEQGVWSLQGEPSWKNAYYLYEVKVFMPDTGAVEFNLVTDPYSMSVGMNSKKSQIIDINDPSLKPPGWDSYFKSKVVNPTDISIYELHIRDFSIADDQLQDMYKGTYLAFTQFNSRGMQHLARLAQAGLTHIHLLPFLDFVSVDEDRSKQLQPNISPYWGADSIQQQQAVKQVRDRDSYNWGYDPYHYFVPDGSYSLNPEGARRIWEVRAMVMGLRQIGLGVFWDVVYNHTMEAGPGEHSVLDKIVPGYYYRLNDYGKVYNSSCCADTASERLMMEKLIIDSLKFLAKTYRVDGFRFDLMNLHTVTNAHNFRRALDTMTLAKDGVDGSRLYLYGEGWNFGSINATRPRESFHQLNSFGAGIGMFNDRIRDAIRGGSTDPKGKSDPGFVTGLFYDFNQEPANRNTPTSSEGQRELLLHYTDVIRIGLAGNLRDYYIRDLYGNTVRAADLRFKEMPVGYTAEPKENINYVSAHDGYSLWDAVNAKAPFGTPGRNPRTASNEERVRMNNLALALVTLGQGIPFYAGGSELLRSKSGDYDSYDSGDWFNRMFFNYAENGWGMGLPVDWKNGGDWSFWQPRLASPEMKPSPNDIKFASRYFESLLKIRYSSRLFRLPSFNDARERVRFLNADRGWNQIPGLIVMDLRDDLPNLYSIDPNCSRILVFFNANRGEVYFQDNQLKNLPLQIHNALGGEVDPYIKGSNYWGDTGTVKIPPRSTLVYCSGRNRAVK